MPFEEALNAGSKYASDLGARGAVIGASIGAVMGFAVGVLAANSLTAASSMAAGTLWVGIKASVEVVNKGLILGSSMGAATGYRVGAAVGLILGLARYLQFRFAYEQEKALIDILTMYRELSDGTVEPRDIVEHISQLRGLPAYAGDNVARRTLDELYVEALWMMQQRKAA